MADEFGFVADSEASSVKSDDFGFVPDSSPVATNPLAEQQAIERQYIADQRPNFLRTATTPLRVGFDTVAGLISSLNRGVQGAGTLAGEASGSETPIQTGVGNLAQTALEVVPRAAFGLADILRQAGTYTVQNPQGAARNINAFVNPVGTALQESFFPREAPSEKEVADAVMRQLQNQVYAEQQAQPIAPEIFGQANIPLAQAIPDLAATALGAPELAAIGRGALARIGPVATETARTAATIASTPLTGYRIASEVNPYLSGSKLAGAEESLASALAKQASDEVKLASSEIVDAAELAAQRGEAATAGRGALQAGRELRTAESTLRPQIINAQTTLDQVVQSPVVILGKNAEDAPAAFGRSVIKATQKELQASKDIYDDAYADIKTSLPSQQPELPASNLLDAARKGKQELSEGFEAYNKGQIKQILDESSRMQAGDRTLVRNIYDNAPPSIQKTMRESNPELANPPIGSQPVYNWNELQRRFHQINEGIDQAIQHGNTGDIRILGDLKRGIDADMEAYAKNVGGDTYKLFKEANAKYSEHQDKFGLNRIQSILKDDVIQNPQGVATKLISDNNAPMVEAVKVIVTPEQFQAVQAQFAQKLFSPKIDVSFDPSHFADNFSKRGTAETYKAVFGEDGYRQLNEIYDATKGFDKIADMQKTLDNLQKDATSTAQTFAKKRGRATETEAAQATKEALRQELDAINASKITDVQAARNELDRVKNYRDLRNWASRFTGLNILKAAWGSPKGIALNRRLAASGLLVATPNETEDLNDVIRNNNRQ